MADQTAQRPVMQFRAGGIRAAIWRNEIEQDGRTVVRHSVRIDKRYFDAQRDEWKDSDYLFVNDLPRVRLVVEKAFEYVTLNDRQPDAEQGPDSDSQACTGNSNSSAA